MNCIIHIYNIVLRIQVSWIMSMFLVLKENSEQIFLIHSNKIFDLFDFDNIVINSLYNKTLPPVFSSCKLQHLITNF